MEEAETGLTLKEVERMRQAASKSSKSKEGTAEASPAEGELKESAVASGSKPGSGKEVEERILDLGLVKSDPKKVYPLIYYALKVSLRIL